MAEAHRVEIRVPDGSDVGALLRLARQRASAIGVDLEGDERAGTFDGMAEGTYAVSGELLTIEVTSKPSVVPWPLLRRQLVKAFEQ